MRRYGSYKGPLAVAPLFLALLVFCLVERQVRRAIAPDLTLARLSVGQPAKPTGRLIFEVLARLRLLPASGHDPPVIPSHHRCKPDCCTCWTWTPPSPAEQPHKEDPMRYGSDPPHLRM